jgi:hypothetical protein
MSWMKKPEHTFYALYIYGHRKFQSDDQWNPKTYSYYAHCQACHRPLEHTRPTYDAFSNKEADRRISLLGYQMKMFDTIDDCVGYYKEAKYVFLWDGKKWSEWLNRDYNPLAYQISEVAI